MGRVRAAGFRQRGLREAAGQHRRPAQGDRDFVFQGSGCRLGETGNPDRPQGRWQGSVWPVGHSNQHYGKPISKTGASPRTAMIWNFRRSGQEPDLSLMLKHAVYALDSTTIDLCLSMFDWAAFRRTKAAVKL